jgi:hypothetical protein
MDAVRRGRRDAGSLQRGGGSLKTAEQENCPAAPRPARARRLQSVLPRVRRLQSAPWVRRLQSAHLGTCTSVQAGPRAARQSDTTARRRTPSRQDAPRPALQQRIQRTAHPMPAAVQHVRIDHRRRHVRVPEQLLHRADVVARLQQMRRKGMAKCVRAREGAREGVRSCNHTFPRCITGCWIARPDPKDSDAGLQDLTLRTLSKDFLRTSGLQDLTLRTGLQDLTLRTCKT